MANNVQNVKFLRNAALFTNHDAARVALEGFTLTDEQDGSLILARYGSGNDVKTLAGLVYYVGEYKSITILDIDSEAADIEKLRQEINAKLGSGVTSANTATAQLEALSGSNSDTSATTSVAGAKKYADALISGLDYTDAAEAGKYVSQVTEADGIIAVTRVELPSMNEVHEDGKPIIAISEDKGQVAASAGTINSKYVTVNGFTATDVQGALEEISGDVTSKIEGLDYTGITTSNAAVVTNVTEVDGVVAATSANVGGLKLTGYSKGSDSGSVASTDSINEALAKLENQIDAEEAARAAAINALDLTTVSGSGEVIVSVGQEDGQVSATSSKIKDVVLTGYVKGNGVGDIEPTDSVNGALSKLENNIAAVEAANTLKAADESIVVETATTGTTVAVNIKSGEKVIMLDNNAGGGIYTDIKLSGITPSSTTVKEEYALMASDGTTQLGSSIKIYKDSSLVSITYITNPADAHYQNLKYVYIDASGNTQTEYVDISSLVLEAEFASGVTVTDHVAHGVVDSTSEAFLTVGAGGFKLSGVQNAINTAVSTAVEALDADVSGNSTHVTVGVEEVNGVITGVSVSESDIASANELSTLSGRVDVIEPIYVSGVSVNGNAVSVNNHVAPISISAATSATTATGNEAITVNTDSNGNITLGIATIDCGTY